jgi:hypothetical protein
VILGKSSFGEVQTFAMNKSKGYCAGSALFFEVLDDGTFKCKEMKSRVSPSKFTDKMLFLETHNHSKSFKDDHGVAAGTSPGRWS